MDDLVDKWNNLNVTEEEDDVEVVDDEILEDSREEAEFVLLGKLKTDKAFNKKAFKIVIGNLWNVKRALEIHEIQNSIFKFSFGAVEEKKRVLIRQ